MTDITGFGVFHNSSLFMFMADDDTTKGNLMVKQLNRTDKGYSGRVITIEIKE